MTMDAAKPSVRNAFDVLMSKKAAPASQQASRTGKTKLMPGSIQVGAPVPAGSLACPVELHPATPQGPPVTVTDSSQTSAVVSNTSPDQLCAAQHLARTEVISLPIPQHENADEPTHPNARTSSPAISRQLSDTSLRPSDELQVQTSLPLGQVHSSQAGALPGYAACESFPQSQQLEAVAQPCRASRNIFEALSSQPEADDTTFQQPAAKRAKLVPVRPQQYDYFLIYDFEATCNKQRTLAPIEIIELACVVVNARTLKVIGEQQSYVRPTERPILDPFCIELTGIQQAWVDAAPLLSDALQAHTAWLQSLEVLVDGKRLLPVTWTDWDLKVCLEQECSWRKISKPDFLQKWCDLKKAFSSKYKKTGNLRKCVEAAGLTWQGRAHSGLDDARNTAAIAIHLVQEGAGSAAADSMKQATIAPVQQHSPYDAQGLWNGHCRCGVKANLRTTKKPGANHGRQFYSCGRWTITQKSQQCSFFVWTDEVKLAPGTSAPLPKR